MTPSSQNTTAPTVATPTLTHEQFLATRTFANLDGVRALAVLWVVAFHGEPFGEGLLARFLQAGPAGVDAFFVLSGFLITTLLLREPPRPRGQVLRGFYVRRAIRLFPLFYAAVPLYALLAWRSGVPNDSEQFGRFLPWLLFYCADWFLAGAPVPTPRYSHAWSLAIEEKFYLLWPVIALCGARVARRVTLFAIAAVVAWRLVLVTQWSGPEQGARFYYSFEARVDTLMWGALLATLLHDPAHYRRIAAWCARPAFFWSLLVAFVAMVTWLPPALPALQYTIAPPMLAALLAAVVLRPQLAGLGLLRTRGLAWIGKVSYGVYVLHPLVISVLHTVLLRVMAEPRPWLTLPIYMGASIAVASASYRWFEAPLLRLKERFR